jgi:hypothetical protein
MGELQSVLPWCYPDSMACLRCPNYQLKGLTSQGKWDEMLYGRGDSPPTEGRYRIS